MNEQINHEPIHEGVQHGPYEVTQGDPYETFDKQRDAVEYAYQEGFIKDRDADKLDARINLKEGDRKRQVMSGDDSEMTEQQASTARILRSISENSTNNSTESDEDPLAGDVDNWVHRDETRTDEQIAHDDKYEVDPY